MTPQEAAALLTYANQVDARVQLNEANADVWAHALRNTDYTKARWCVREHYSSDVDGGPPRSIAPGMIRARVNDLTRAAEDKRAQVQRRKDALELEATPRHRPLAPRNEAEESMTPFQRMMSRYVDGIKSLEQ